MPKRLNNIKELDKCANCGACYSVCPVSAISLCDTGIFYKYEVNEELCLHCGQCIHICPIQNTENKNHLIGAYWGMHKSDQIVLSSSSGGCFRPWQIMFLKRRTALYLLQYIHRTVVGWKCWTRKMLQLLNLEGANM